MMSFGGNSLSNISLTMISFGINTNICLFVYLFCRYFKTFCFIHVSPLFPIVWTFVFFPDQTHRLHICTHLCKHADIDNYMHPTYMYKFTCTYMYKYICTYIHSHICTWRLMHVYYRESDRYECFLATKIYTCIPRCHTFLLEIFLILEIGISTVFFIYNFSIFSKCPEFPYLWKNGN